MLQNKSDDCFNCGKELKEGENYCPDCGQKNTDLNISLREISKEFAGDYFTFDSKFFITLIPLLFRPGKVPKEYIDGKRVKHIPPLRIFIFLSFITFFLWGSSFNNNASLFGGDKVDILADSLTANEVFLDSINVADNIELRIQGDTASNDTVLSNDLRFMLDKENDPKYIVDSLVSDSNQFLKKVVYQGLRMYQAEKGTVKKYFMENISIVLLLIQPFFALLLKLVYIRRKNYFYIEHLVFSLYLHAFVLFTSILLYFLTFYIDINTLILWFTLVFIIYLTIALKRFYEQKWFKTLIKSTIISFSYLMIILPVFVLLYLFTSLYFY